MAELNSIAAAVEGLSAALGGGHGGGPQHGGGAADRLHLALHLVQAAVELQHWAECSGEGGGIGQYPATLAALCAGTAGAAVATGVTGGERDAAAAGARSRGLVPEAVAGGGCSWELLRLLSYTTVQPGWAVLLPDAVAVARAGRQRETAVGPGSALVGGHAVSISDAMPLSQHACCSDASEKPCGIIRRGKFVTSPPGPPPGGAAGDRRAGRRAAHGRRGAAGAAVPSKPVGQTPAVWLQSLPRLGRRPSAQPRAGVRGRGWRPRVPACCTTPSRRSSLTARRHSVLFATALSRIELNMGR